jgi:Protein of unknown function (DUF732)
MAHFAIRTGLSGISVSLMLSAAGFAAAVSMAAPTRADTVAYLVNVTVRPGYNFANAEQALGYGYALCDKVAAGRSYGQVLEDIQADFNATDHYQASYLITQAVNELCPAQIWQLRNSAAGYRSTGPA